MVLAALPSTWAMKEAAAWLAIGENAVVSGLSAAYRRGLLPYPRARADVEITTATGHAEPRLGIRVRRTRRLDPDEREVLDGVPTTTVDRTLLDLAAGGGDRDLEPRDFERCSIPRTRPATRARRPRRSCWR